MLQLQNLFAAVGMQREFLWDDSFDLEGQEASAAGAGSEAPPLVG
jgi:hypothetical protein